MRSAKKMESPDVNPTPLDKKKLKTVIDLTTDLKKGDREAIKKQYEEDEAYITQTLKKQSNGELKTYLNELNQLLGDKPAIDEYLKRDGEEAVDFLTHMAMNGSIVENILLARGEDPYAEEEQATSVPERPNRPSGPRQSEHEYLADVLDEIARDILDRFTAIKNGPPKSKVTRNQSQQATRPNTAPPQPKSEKSGAKFSGFWANYNAERPPDVKLPDIDLTEPLRKADEYFAKSESAKFTDFYQKYAFYSRPRK